MADKLTGIISIKKSITGQVLRAERIGGIPYAGTYTVTPTKQTQTLETADKVMQRNVTINPIGISVVANPSGGETVTIGIE